MKAEGVSSRHAVELLRADLPAMSSGAGTDSEPVRQSTVQKLPSPLDFDAEDQELLLQVVDYYHETLKSSREAMEYLGSRGIGDRTRGYRRPSGQRLRLALSAMWRSKIQESTALARALHRTAPAVPRSLPASSA